MWEAEPVRIRSKGGRGISRQKSNIHDDADRHAECVDCVGGMVSRPDCVGGMVSSDPSPAFGKGTHQSLIQWAGTTSIVVGSSPLSGQYREHRLVPSSRACRVRPVSLVCLVHLVDLVCLEPISKSIEQHCAGREPYETQSVMHNISSKSVNCPLLNRDISTTVGLCIHRKMILR